MTYLDEDDTTQITELLMGRKVTDVLGDVMTLDNGTRIKVQGNDGGCSCGAGDYELSVLNRVDNIITNVEFDYRPAGDGDYVEFDENDPDAPGSEYEGFYRIYVFAGHEKINLLQVDGTDGNGYYGTGFSLTVEVK